QTINQGNNQRPRRAMVGRAALRLHAPVAQAKESKQGIVKSRRIAETGGVIVQTGSIGKGAAAKQKSLKDFVLAQANMGGVGRGVRQQRLQGVHRAPAAAANAPSIQVLGRLALAVFFAEVGP